MRRARGLASITTSKAGFPTLATQFTRPEKKGFFDEGLFLIFSKSQDYKKKKGCTISLNEHKSHVPLNHVKQRSNV